MIEKFYYAVLCSKCGSGYMISLVTLQNEKRKVYLCEECQDELEDKIKCSRCHEYKDEGEYKAINRGWCHDCRKEYYKKAQQKERNTLKYDYIY